MLMMAKDGLANDLEFSGWPPIFFFHFRHEFDSTSPSGNVHDGNSVSK